MTSKNTAPDGGWGWIVVAASAVSQMLTIGLLWALSILYVSWLEEFDQGKGTTSWVISLGFSLLFIAGPISASLAARFGYRAVVIAGGLMTSVGIILSFWATSVQFLIAAIGLISGLGCGLTYIPAVAIVPVYFDRKRSLASGLSLSGVSIGSFILAPLLEALETTYGWRGTLLILGALTLNIILCGAVMRPLCPDTTDDVTVAQQERIYYYDRVKPLQEERGKVNECWEFRSSSEHQTGCDVIIINDAQEMTDGVQIKRPDSQKAEISSNEGMRMTPLQNCHDDVQLSTEVPNEMDERSPFLTSVEREKCCRSKDELQTETAPCPVIQTDLFDRKGAQHAPNACDDISGDPGEKLRKQTTLVNTALLRVVATGKVCGGSMHNLETSREHLQLSLQEHKAISVNDLRVRHIESRNPDYPFTGSVQCFKNLLLASTPALSHADITDNPHKHVNNKSAKVSDCDRRVTKSNRLTSSQRKILSILKENIQEAMNTNGELMKDLPFMILVISHMLLCIAAFTVSVYMVDRMVFQGLDKSLGAMIVSVTSAFNFTGRIFFGFAADRMCKDHMALYIGTVGVSGLSTLLSPLCGANVYLHGLYAAVVGFTTGGSSTLTFVVNVDVMGVARVASSYGLLLTFMGLGNLVGMPMAGWLFDWTRNYTIPYIVQGLCFVIADLMLIGLYVCKGKSQLNGLEAVIPET